MRPNRALATTLGMVLVLVCVIPEVIECDAFFAGVAEMLGAVALACFALAGAAARPRGSARLGALLGAGLYLLPGVLLVCLPVASGLSTGDIDWYSLRFLLSWPSFPVAMANCAS